MSTNVHITGIDGTKAEVRSYMDEYQSGILTDNSDTNAGNAQDNAHCHATSSAAEILVEAMSKSINPLTGAETYLSVEFSDIYAHDDLFMNDKLYHYGDTDTYIGYGADAIAVQAGGELFITIVQDTQSYIGVNNSSADIDFYVNAAGVTDALKVRGSDGFVGIGETDPAARVEIKSTYAAPFFMLTDASISTGLGVATGLSDDAFFGIKEKTNGNGGAEVIGISEDTGTAGLRFIGIASSIDSTVGAVQIITAYDSITNYAPVDDDDIAFEILNYIQPKFRVYGDGTTKIYSDTGTDSVNISHDDTDAFIKWSDGSLNLATDEGTNTSSVVYITGKGSGYGFLSLGSSTNPGELTVIANASAAYITTETLDLGINIDGLHDVNIFSSSSAGRTRELKIYGFRAGDGASAKSLEIGVGVDAADTASFDGVSNYLFDGSILAAATSYYYFGDESTNDSWRWYISSGDLVFEKRESGSWVEKLKVEA